MTGQTVRAWSEICLSHPVAQRMFVCPELRDKETGTIYWILPRIQKLHFAFAPGKLISVHAGLLILHTNRENVEPHCAVFITHHSPLQRAKWCLQCSTLNSPQSNTTRNNFVIITKKSQVNPRKPRQKAATNSRRNSRSLAKAISTILYPQRRDDVNCKTSKNSTHANFVKFSKPACWFLLAVLRHAGANYGCYCFPKTVNSALRQ